MMLAIKMFWAAMLVLPLAAVGADSRAGMEVLKNTTGRPVSYAGQLSGEHVLLPSVYHPKPSEVRGVWVATIDNIDFPPHSSVDAFKHDFAELLTNLQRANINTIFFQVRPMNDAFYRSRLNPWSRFLTGAEGRPLPGNFDPMEYMIAESHRRGIMFHAWLNPYRVTKNAERSKMDYLNTLASNNFARLNPSMVMDVYNSGKRQLMLDPGEPQVVNFLINTVKEIVANYDVDGIHFDDYFYPYSGCGNADARTFARYNSRHLSLENWRTENVNALVWGVSKAIEVHNHTARKRVQFGISPFGIWRNIKNDSRGSLTSGSESLSNQYADTRQWIKSGWIDYVIPQVYWPFEHEKAAYAAVTDWWVQTVRGTRVSLYIGHIPGYYGMGLWQNPREISNQLRYNLKHSEIKGEVMFSYKSLFRPENYPMRKGSEMLFRECWFSYVPPAPASVKAPASATSATPAVRPAATPASRSNR